MPQCGEGKWAEEVISLCGLFMTSFCTQLWIWWTRQEVLPGRHHDFPREQMVWLLRTAGPEEHQDTGHWAISAEESPAESETVWDV